MTKLIKTLLLVACLFGGLVGVTMAQDEAADGDAAAAAETDKPKAGTTTNTATDAPTGQTSLWSAITGGGFMGIILWLAIFAASIVALALIIDSSLTVKESKIIPDAFVYDIKEAMEMGDVMKAQRHCEEQPGALSNILLAGFSNVEEGFEAIQDSISVAADLESEKLLQRVNYLNVVGNIAPMLGLAGTVQGMIAAFANLNTAGPAKAALLATNISQALWTTLIGLFIAIPVLVAFYYFRNKATRIILHMEALTLEEVKVLRHAEIVEEDDEE